MCIVNSRNNAVSENNVQNHQICSDLKVNSKNGVMYYISNVIVILTNNNLHLKIANDMKILQKKLK